MKKRYKKIKKIVVAFDGSIYSKRAFQMALSITRQYKTKLAIISCIEKINDSIYGMDLTLHYQKHVKKI